MKRKYEKYFIVGGAGFIGSHIVTEILNTEKDSRVTVYDNFSSGRLWHLDSVKNNKNLHIIKGDVKDLEFLINSMKGSDIVYHLASNPDISKAITQPDIDFWEGTYLTNNILESMRLSGINKLLYTSGSGIYGDTDLVEIAEDYAPLLPISTYGASKLACESMICSYCHMFDFNATSFRFANVVGPRQTHGVGYDFVRKLLQNKRELLVLGDGDQSKSYIYIADVISAMKLLQEKAPLGFSYYNVATLDYITVNEIADITIKVMGLKDVKFIYTGGKRGWKGDIPVVRLNSNKIRKLGWRNKYNSREAVKKSIESIYEEIKRHKF